MAGMARRSYPWMAFHSEGASPRSRGDSFGNLAGRLALFVALALLMTACPNGGDEEEGRPTGQGGEVHGYVFADIRSIQDDNVRGKGSRIFLPDVEVYLKDPSSSAESPRVKTDFKGFFMIPHQPAGTYELCMEAPGYESGCRPANVVVDDLTVYLGPVGIAPRPGIISGRVTFKDGPACLFEDHFFGISTHTRVKLEDGTGAEVVPPVKANSLGEYLLPEVPSGNFDVIARCEGAKVDRAVGASGTNSLDLVLPNTSTQIETVTARVGGDGVRNVDPATTVDVEVQARDPDGDALHYIWGPSGSDGGFVSQDSPATEWALPDSRGRHTMFVVAHDGKGAYGLGKVDVSTGGEGVLFTGRVTQVGGLPIPRAAVEVGGKRTETNGEGFFEVTVPKEADRYVLNIEKPGFQLLSKVFSSGVIGGEYTLERAQKFAIDPTSDVRVVEERQERKLGSEIVIPPDSLVDKDGNRVTAPVDLFMSTIDLTDPEGRFPGDYAAEDAGGQDVTLESFGAVQVDIQDGAGDPVNLAPGASATIRIPVHPDQLAAPGGPPPTIPLWSYRESEGIWQEEGTATLVGDFYEGQVEHLSVINADVEFTNPACIRLVADTTRLTLPFDVRVTVPTGTGLDKIVQTTVADQVSVIVRLPANTAITIDVLDSAGNPIPAARQTVNSGAPNSGPAFPPYPYSPCNAQANLTFAAPTDGGFLDYIGLSNAADAADYYTRIDPSSSKTTLAAWKTANGFNAGDDASAVYFNAGDLGFGRSMHMKKTGSDISYYVTNYPTVEEARLNINEIATVAMEYSEHPTAGGPRYTKFYVFNAAGNRVDSADLDGRGQKFVPRLCVICHGGNPASMDAQGRMGARFIPFDLASFQYSTFENPPFSGTFPFGRAAQEPAFKILNQGVLDTNSSAAVTELVHGWYGGAALPAATQDSTFVPTGWTTPVDRSALYSNVLEPSCRSCHATRDTPLDWARYTGPGPYPNFGLKESGSFAKILVCDSRVMPQARTTFLNFWLSTSPHQPAALGNGGLNGWAPADPCPVP